LKNLFKQLSFLFGAYRKRSVNFKDIQIRNIPGMTKQKANAAKTGNRKKEATKNAAKAMKPGKLPAAKSNIDEPFMRRLC
jgi:hypothetical protein